MKLNLLLNALFLLLFIASVNLHARTSVLPPQIHNHVDREGIIEFNVGNLNTAEVAEKVLKGLEKQWYLFDSKNGTEINGEQITYPGIGYLNLINFLSTQKRYQGPYKPKVTIVAVIDSGTDINHEALRDKLWKNEKEINGKPGVDDDNNGYVDDYYGWNFIGKTLDPSEYATVGGKNIPLNGLGAKVAVDGDTLEVTRNYLFLKKYKDQVAAGGSNDWNKIYEVLKKEVESERSNEETNEATQWPFFKQLIESSEKNVNAAFAEKGRETIQLNQYLDQTLLSVFMSNAAPYNFFEEIPLKEAKNIAKIFFNWYWDDIKGHFNGWKNHYNLDISKNTRKTIVGDDDIYDLWPQPERELTEDEEENYIPLLTRYNLVNKIHKVYGNNDVIGTKNSHGTHVSGLIGIRDYTNSDLMTKLFKQATPSKVQIMTLRTVPNGDERDKDVANSIIYAVDNGAHYINMSFGKSKPSLYFDTNTKEIKNGQILVNLATKYARRTDLPNKDYETVLVHAAGNSSKNLSLKKSRNYPNRYYNENGKIVQHSNYVTIGASFRSIEPIEYVGKEAGIVASFTNFGKYNVDILSPGKQIYSTTPNNMYEYFNGTSMAAPVATGVFAELKSNFSQYSPSEIAIVTIANSFQISQQVEVPNTGISKEQKGTLAFLKDYFIYDRVINIKSGFDVLASLSSSAPTPSEPNEPTSEPEEEVKKRSNFGKWLRRIFTRRNKRNKKKAVTTVTTQPVVEKDLESIKLERNAKYQSNLEAFAPTEEYVFGYKID